MGSRGMLHQTILKMQFAFKALRLLATHSMAQKHVNQTACIARQALTSQTTSTTQANPMCCDWPLNIHSVNVYLMHSGLAFWCIDATCIRCYRMAAKVNNSPNERALMPFRSYILLKLRLLVLLSNHCHFKKIKAGDNILNTANSTNWQSSLVINNREPCCFSKQSLYALPANTNVFLAFASLCREVKYLSSREKWQLEIPLR